MPLFTYKCDEPDCNAQAIEMLSKEPLETVKCPECGGMMTRRFKPCQMRYGKNMHAKPTGKDQFVTGLGRRISDPFEYAKAMDAAGLRRTSAKEMEQIQSEVKRNVADEKKKAQQEAVKEQLAYLRSR